MAQQWIETSPTSGTSGTSSVAVTASGNTGVTRTTEITVTATKWGMTRSATVSIEQVGAITGISMTSISPDDTGGTYQITVSSESAYNVTVSDPTWIIVSPASGGPGVTTITVIIPANQAGSARTGTISVETTDHQYSDSTTVTQQAVYIPTGITIIGTVSPADTGGSYTITIESESPFVISASDSTWIAVSPSSGGSGTTTVTVTVAGNDTGTGRTGSITAMTTDNQYTDVITFSQASEEPTTTTTTQPPHDYSSDYFTTRSLANNNTISFIIPAQITSAYASSISYSTDSGNTWNTTFVTSSNQTISVSGLSSGDTVLWKGIAQQWYFNASSKFRGTGSYSVEGNAMSLLYRDDFSGKTVAGGHSLGGLFSGSTTLVSAANLRLPATTLAEYCYQYMFAGCTSLTTAPELPATTLAGYCYSEMFRGCTSLTTAPELPATTLAGGGYCYSEMFSGCTSLVTPPALPATPLARGCYRGMFEGCTSLTTAPALTTATTLPAYCYARMFKGCTSLVTAIKPCIDYADVDSFCFDRMFADCTSLTTVPELPLVVLSNDCYHEMFSGCTSLNYIKCKAMSGMIVQRLVADNTYNWVDGVASSGTFVKAATGAWTIGTGGIPSGWTVVTEEEPTPEPHDYSRDYFTTTSFSDNNTLSIEFTTSTPEYSIDNGNTWVSGSTVSGLSSGDSVLWRYTCSSGDNIYINANKYVEIKGNVLSLYYGDDFINKTAYPEGSARIAFLSSIKSVLLYSENLVLPSGSVTTSYFYQYMFSGCTNLIRAPKILPATTLAAYCYANMFSGCYFLTTAPELPATTLAVECYYSMFYDCLGLTTAPALPATNLSGATSCYTQMFRGCTNLTTAPALPGTTLADGCYANMFRDCTNLTTAPALPATVMENACYSYMFGGCTSISGLQSNYLPATTLAESCYKYMFGGCTSLITAPALPATTLANGCYDSMFDGCTNLTTAPELPAISLRKYCYNHMFIGCSSLQSITCLATSGINSNSSTTNWVSGVNASGTFVKASGATWPTGTHGIPSGWTVVDAT